MITRLTIVLAALLAATPAFAQSPDPTPIPTPTPAPTPIPTATPIPTEPSAPEDLPDLARPTLVPPLPRQHEQRIFGSLEAAYAYEALYGVPINAVDFTGLLGDDLGSWGIGVQADVSLGRTDGGLSTSGITLGAVSEAHLDRWRLGGGVRLGGFSVRRATVDAHLETLTAGLFGRFSVDVLQFDETGNGALFVVGKLTVDATALEPLYGVSAGVGVRF